MKTKFLFPIFVLAVLALLLGSCTIPPTSWPSVIADSEYAYVAGGPFVYAVNLQTGVEAWRFPEKASTASPFLTTPVLTEDGQLIVGGYDHKLYSLNPATGQEQWSFTEARDRWIGSVLVANGLIYAPNADYNLYVLDMNGILQWTFDAKQSIWSTPVTDGVNVYFGTLGNVFMAMDANAESKTPVWSVELEGAALGTPVLKDGVLYIGLFDGGLVALDARDGSLLWTSMTGSWVWSGPVLVDETLYFGDGSGNFYAMNLSGNVIWNQELAGAMTGTPLVNGDRLIIGTESGNVYFLDLNGETISPVSVAGIAYGSPAAGGDAILIGLTENEEDAILVALDENGAVLWSFIPKK